MLKHEHEECGILSLIASFHSHWPQIKLENVCKSNLLNRIVHYTHCADLVSKNVAIAIKTGSSSMDENRVVNLGLLV